jgi:hypothetical protein
MYQAVYCRQTERNLALKAPELSSFDPFLEYSDYGSIDTSYRPYLYPAL